MGSHTVRRRWTHTHAVLVRHTKQSSMVMRYKEHMCATWKLSGLHRISVSFLLPASAVLDLVSPGANIMCTKRSPSLWCALLPVVTTVPSRSLADPLEPVRVRISDANHPFVCRIKGQISAHLCLLASLSHTGQTSWLDGTVLSRCVQSLGLQRH